MRRRSGLGILTDFLYPDRDAFGTGRTGAGEKETI